MIILRNIGFVFYIYAFFLSSDKADGKAGISPTSPYGTYLQTDLDSGEQLDLAQASSPFANGSHNSYHPDGEGNGVLMSDGASSRPVINHQRQVWL